MKIKSAILSVLLALVLVACEDTETTVISSTTAITSFYLYSPNYSTVKSCYFTIDTVTHEIYNEDSLDFGVKLDSLAPIMYPTFVTAVIDDSINLYDKDTVYVDFTVPRRLKVKCSTGDTATYKITVNVHQVDPDSFVWRKVYDLGSGVIERQGAAMTDDYEMFWLRSVSGQLEMYSSVDGESWSEESVQGLPSTVDVEHIIANGNTLCVMSDNVLYRFNGLSWSSSQTISSVSLRHLLMSFKGDLYALGTGNVILKLDGAVWKTAAEFDSGFPIKGECAFVGESVTGIEMAYVALGIDKNKNCLQDVWSTEDGSYWVKLTDKENSFSRRGYAMVRQYGKGLLAIGGKNADSLVTDNMMYSKDYGITWDNGDSLYHLDTTVVRGYAMRYGGTMMINALGEVFVIGGRDSSGVVLGDVWRGLHYADIPGFEE